MSDVLDVAFAMVGLFLFALVFGLAADNHAAMLDPASPYYSTQR
jgi:hypothetical protein